AGRAAAAVESLEDTGAGGSTTADLLRLHVEVARTAARHAAVVKRFRTGHPGTPVVEVPAASRDIHDVDGLRAIGDALAAG
ncbi:MAG: ArsA family ATPase, partial [Nostocoides sp.]